MEEYDGDERPSFVFSGCNASTLYFFKKSTKEVVIMLGA
jgi:hypothetical protein